MISARARTVIIAIVTLVWLGNFLASLFIDGYQTSESINGIFMAIVGTLFVLKKPDLETKTPAAPPPGPPVAPPLDGSVR